MEKNYKSILIRAVLICSFFYSANVINAQTVVTHTFTGVVQSFTVPPCVTQLSVDLRGAKGGTGYQVYSQGGNGGRVVAVIPVTAGQVLQIRVGGVGGNASTNSGGAGGYNGGGLGATYSGQYGGGGGGGASDIRISPYGFNDRLIVAAGGGGGAFDYTTTDSERGGEGGGTTGESGSWGGTVGYAYAGGGGSPTTGGTAGFFSGYCGASTGSFGIGGNGGPCTNSGGGGGGGWYGGGGGVWGGGGGGSNYVVSTGSNVTHTRGSQTSNGSVSFTYALNGSVVTGAISPTAICTGGTATLTAGNVTSYTWSTGSNASSITVAPGATTPYTVQGTNSTGCVTSLVLTVSVSTGPPVLAINSSTNSTCLGKSVVLTATGGLGHSWTGGVTNGVPFVPTTTSGYTVTGTNGCGSATASTTISVVPLPVGVSATSTLVCQLKTVTITAAGATTYSWAPGNQTVSTIVVAPSANTIYTVAASNGTCYGVATITVNTNPNPTINVVASSTTVCEGDAVTLTANGADNYTWTNATITGSTGVVTPTISTMFQLTGTNSFGCAANGQQLVLVEPAPTVNAVANKTLVCSGGPSTIIATGNSSGYAWSTGGTTNSIIVSPLATTVYTVTGTGSNGCSRTKQVTVTVFIPQITVSPSSTICEGASITLTAGPGTQFQWNPGPPVSVNQITVKPTLPTTYTVSTSTVSNAVTCSATNTVYVGLNPKPVVTAQASRTVMCRSKESVVLTASGTATFLWPHNNSTSASTTFTSNLIQTHNLLVIGTDVNGCSDTSIVQIKVNSCTGIGEHQGSSEISIYPNPANGVFTVKSEVEISLALTNELGQVIKSFTLSSGNDYQVNVESLATGVYFLRGQYNGRMISEKIIVTK